MEKKNRLEVLTRPENLRLYWPMDETSGFVLEDSVGLAHANLAGKYNRVAGKIGKAIEFDGLSGYAWTEPVATQLGITGKNSRSVSFWVWLNAYQPSPKAGAYGYGHLSAFDGTDRFWGMESLAQSNFTAFDSTHYSWSFSISHDVELRNTWNHFTHTFDGSNVSVFLNGQLAGTENRSSINTGDIEPLVIGRSSTDYNSFMSGKIDDFRVYDVALSPLEISKIHTANDVVETSFDFQFDFEVLGLKDEVSLNGLPSGLQFDPERLEVTGVPFEVGTFDLNISASNQAGSKQAQLSIIVERTLPVLSSVKPRGISSNGALATGIIRSNGGENVAMTLFWGATNGDKNPGQWENNFTLEGNFSEGRVSHFIENLSLGTSYYYRWMASNSVSPETWSAPSTDGLIHWWSFDDIQGATVIDSVGKNNGTLEHISADARTFAYEGLGLPFTGTPGERVTISGYKGITGNEARTVTLWIQTASPSSTLMDWGGVDTGESWTLVIKDGKPGVKVDQNVALLAGSTINDSSWHHLAVSFPSGSQQLADVSIYVDGQPSETSITFDLDPSTYGPSLWLDATDIDGDGIIDSSISGPISSWNDKSGNNINATQSNADNKPTVSSSVLNGNSVVSFDGTDDYISSTGLNITQPYSIFLVAKTNNNTLGRDYLFDGFGSNQNHRSLVALDNSDRIQMWANNSWANSNFNTPTDYFVLSAVFNTSNSSLGLNGTGVVGLSIGTSSLTNGIRIGANCNANADFLKGSIAEFLILNEASDTNTIRQIEGYLAHKWGLTSNLDTSHPSSVLSLSETKVNTSVDRDVTIGGYLAGENFSGTLDEIKIYDRGLSAADVSTLYLDGTVKFTTTTTRQPPVVELYG
ncbi:MAG: LamG domain-containing protein, partial [Opitutales bacterium]